MRSRLDTAQATCLRVIAISKTRNLKHETYNIRTKNFVLTLAIGYRLL